jgi:hypothetical protein
LGERHRLASLRRRGCLEGRLHLLGGSPAPGVDERPVLEADQTGLDQAGVVHPDGGITAARRTSNSSTSAGPTAYRWILMSAMSAPLWWWSVVFKTNAGRPEGHLDGMRIGGPLRSEGRVMLPAAVAPTLANLAMR